MRKTAKQDFESYDASVYYYIFIDIMELKLNILFIITSHIVNLFDIFLPVDVQLQWLPHCIGYRTPTPAVLT